MYNYYIPSSKYIAQANTPLRLQNGPLITIPNLINETLQPHHIEKMQKLSEEMSIYKQQDCKVN